MARFCTNCGCELPEAGSVCPNCGAAVTETPKKKKLKWWMVAIPVVMVLAVLTVALWTPLSIRFAPEAALASAAAKTVMELKDRYEGSPYPVFVKANNDEGKYTLSLQTAFDDGYGSTSSLDMQMAVDAAAKAVDADLTISQYGMALDIGLYLDAECAAFGSETLLGETHYGITYGTFSQDLRSNQLMSSLLDEETMTSLETAVDSIKTGMENMTANSTESGLNTAYKEIFTTFVKQLKAQVGSGKITLAGEERSCHTISYTFTGAQLAELIDQILAAWEADTSVRGAYTDEAWEEYTAAIQEASESIRSNVTDCTISYFLYKNRLVNMRGVINSVEDGTAGTIQTDLNLGLDAATDPIALTMQITEGEETGTVLCTLETSRGTAFSEVLNITVNNTDGTESSSRIYYNWDPDSGSFPVCVDNMDDGTSVTLYMNLKELDNGFTLALNQISGNDETQDITFHTTVTSGAEIQKPEYRNLDSWSISDFYQFFGILG